MSSATIEAIKIVPYVVGGIVVAWYWNHRKHTLDRYRYLDEIYHRLLQRYQEVPRFGDIELTTRYRQSYKGEEALCYHYFAMTAHTVMESVFDQFKGNVPAEWLPVFTYHSSLHAAWLWDNRGANRSDYVDRVLAAEPVATTPARGANKATPSGRTRSRRKKGKKGS